MERVLDAFGVSSDEVAIVGRLVLHDHVYTEAEELIALSEEAVAKGRVISRIFTTTTGKDLARPPRDARLKPV